MATQWVQHISGQGGKWEIESLDYTYPHLWVVKDHQVSNLYINNRVLLPKSEYRLCDPSDVWEKVEVGIREEQPEILYLKDVPQLLNYAVLDEGFRWAYSGDGVIVERRKS